VEARVALPPRLGRELAGLRKAFEGLDYRDAGQWVLLPGYPLTPGWSDTTSPIAFQVPPGFPAAPPYGFYVPATLRFDGKVPQWQHPPANKPPFSGNWAFFSWAIDGNWSPPRSEAIGGCSLRSFVDSFAQRFAEGTR
jgi:hypothetical protein